LKDPSELAVSLLPLLVQSTGRSHSLPTFSKLPQTTSDRWGFSFSLWRKKEFRHYYCSMHQPKHCWL